MDPVQHEIAQDLESQGNAAPLTPPQPQKNENVGEKAANNNSEAATWSRPLFDALMRRDLGAIKQILLQSPEAINGPVGEYGETPLGLALREELGKSIIKELIDGTPPEGLAKEIHGGWTPLGMALSLHNIPVAKLLMAKDGQLWRHEGEGLFEGLWLGWSAARGLREMTFFLYATNPDVNIFKTLPSEYFLHFFASRQCGFVLLLLQRHPEMAMRSLNILKNLVMVPYAFRSAARLNVFSKIIYSCIPMDFNKVREILDREIEMNRSAIPGSQRHSGVLFSRAYQTVERVASKVMGPLVGHIRKMGDLKLEHYAAVEVLRRTLLEMSMRSEQERIKVAAREVLGQAIRHGTPEVVQHVLPLFRHLRADPEALGESLRLAAQYRDVKILGLLIRYFPHHDKTMAFGRVRRTNFLRAVAKRPRRRQLGVPVGSGVVLQMQRELQWFKGAEKLVLPHDRIESNEETDKTPFEEFEEEHQDMIKSESEWMMSMANSCIVGASLIAAVMFAAAITVPGGNTTDGFPNFSTEAAFRDFAVSDGLALVSSITAVMVFLSIFTTRYSAEDFLYRLPNRLIIGLISVLLSLTFMMVAFGATVYIVFGGQHHYWIIYPTAALACIPVIFFAYLQLPSLLNMIRTTYGPDIYKQVLNVKPTTRDP